MSLTDSRRLWQLAARPEGIHSHDARRMGVSGNPSQRAKDIADRVAFWTKRERRNGRPGSRWWADGFQPDDAIPVKPNFDAEGSHTASSDARVMEQTPRVAPLGVDNDAEGGGGPNPSGKASESADDVRQGEPATLGHSPHPAAPLSAEPVALFDPYTYERRGRYGDEEAAA